MPPQTNKRRSATPKVDVDGPESADRVVPVGGFFVFRRWAVAQAGIAPD